MFRKVRENIAACHARASDCRAKAADAENEAARQAYLDMEKRWLKLVRSYELTDRSVHFINEVERRRRAVESLPDV